MAFRFVGLSGHRRLDSTNSNSEGGAVKRAISPNYRLPKTSEKAAYSNPLARA